MGGSFTAALTEVLETLLHDFPSGFSTSQLYRQVYHKWDYKKTKPFLFDQSRRNHDKIWLRPQEDPEVSRDQPHGLGETRLNLTLRLNKEPGAVIMNQLALTLQYLPHVDEIRIEKLYAPKHQIEDFMLRIIQAQRLRPLMRKLHAKRRLQKLKALAPEENGLKQHSNFFNLFLEQNPESAYDWSSAKSSGCTYNALLQKDLRKSITWPATGRMKMNSLSNRFFSLDWKYNIPDNQGFLSRMLPRRIHTIDFANISLINKSSSSTASSVERPRLENENMFSFMTKDFTRERYLCSEEVWHIFMWLAMIYVQYSLFLFMGDRFERAKDT